MVDFEIMDKVLKIAWIKRIAEPSDAVWNLIPEYATIHYGGLSFLTRCQYGVKFLRLDNLSPSYHTLLKYWQEYNSTTFSDDDHVESEIIWNNCSILINGQPIFYGKWFKNQIIYIKDLLNVDRTFLSLNELKHRFNIEIPFTLFYGLISAIPVEWKKSLKMSCFKLKNPLPPYKTSRQLGLLTPHFLNVQLVPQQAKTEF